MIFVQLMILIIGKLHIYIYYIYIFFSYKPLYVHFEMGIVDCEDVSYNCVTLDLILQLLNTFLIY